MIRCNSIKSTTTPRGYFYSDWGKISDCIFRVIFFNRTYKGSREKIITYQKQGLNLFKNCCVFLEKKISYSESWRVDILGCLHWIIMFIKEDFYMFLVNQYQSDSTGLLRFMDHDMEFTKVIVVKICVVTYYWIWIS